MLKGFDALDKFFKNAMNKNVTWRPIFGSYSNINENLNLSIDGCLGFSEAT